MSEGVDEVKDEKRDLTDANADQADAGAAVEKSDDAIDTEGVKDAIEKGDDAMDTEVVKSVNEEATAGVISAVDKKTETGNGFSVDEKMGKSEKGERNAKDKKKKKGGNGREVVNSRGENKLGNNIKSKFDNLAESSDPDEIRTQVEFYFSNSNLPVDNYLIRMTGGNDNKPVDVEVIHNFKRMKHFQPRSAVIDAIRGSKTLNINDKGGITRKDPLDPKFGEDVERNACLLTEEALPRSVYAKGFGEETGTTHQDIEKWVAPFGPVLSIRLRRQYDGSFKHSIFIEFASEELQKKFMNQERPARFHDKKLVLETQADYLKKRYQGDVRKMLEESRADPLIKRNPVALRGKLGHPTPQAHMDRNREIDERRERRGNRDHDEHRDRNRERGDRDERSGGGGRTEKTIEVPSEAVGIIIGKGGSEFD